MNPFERIADYEFALSLAKRQFPSIDFQSASRAPSGWNTASIEIRDRYNNLICSFESSEYLAYRARNAETQIDSGPRTQLASPTTSRSESPLLPLAARTARSMVGIIKGISYIFSGIIFLTGLALALIATSQGSGLAGLFFFLLAGFLAFVSHWITKLTYIGLEMLADISEDLRLIRLSSIPPV